jgi:hypothetical protein
MSAAAGGAPRARLFVLAGPDVARTFDVAERAVLGRAEECEVRLQHRSVSRRHARIARQGPLWFLEDLGSTNGVVKDGQKIERVELRDGDEFELGDLPLRFRLVPSGPAEAGQAGEPGEIQFARASAVPARPAAQPAPRARPAPGPIGVREIQLEEEIEIGGVSAPARTGLEATRFSPRQRLARGTGFLAGELEQRPFWLRVVIVLLLLALSAGIALAAFQGMALLRRSL